MKKNHFTVGDKAVAVMAYGQPGKLRYKLVQAVIKATKSDNPGTIQACGYIFLIENAQATQIKRVGNRLDDKCYNAILLAIGSARSILTKPGHPFLMGIPVIKRQEWIQQLSSNDQVKKPKPVANRKGPRLTLRR